MSKEEYLKELEYLLQDLPYHEVRDALDYYYDFFEAAGKENESKVIEELGSPEKVAATIKAELKGSFSENIEYSEAGINQEQYRENYEVVENEEIYQTKKDTKHKWQGDPSRNRILLAIIVVAVILMFGFPIASSIIGLFVVLLGIGIIASVGWIFLFILGVILFINSCIYLSSYIGAGIITMGISFIVFALGILFEMIGKKFFKLIPEVFQIITNFIKSLLTKVGVER